MPKPGTSSEGGGTHSGATEAARPKAKAEAQTVVKAKGDSPAKSGNGTPPRNAQKNAAAAGALTSTSATVAKTKTVLAIQFMTEPSKGGGIMVGAMAVALFVHGAFGGATRLVKPMLMEERVEMAIYEPPPPPPPPPEEVKEEPKPEPEKPKPKPKPALTPPPPDQPPPPPSNTEPPPDEPPPSEPIPVVAGISMSSTVKGASGFRVKVGNTTYGKVNNQKVDPDKIKPYRGGELPTKKKPAKFAAVRQASISTPARIVKRFKPKYPRKLLEEGIEGTVVLMVKISKDGTVFSAEVVKKLHPLLDKLSMLVVRKHKWEPAEKDGKKVDSTQRHQVTWEITN